jgi:enediyne biosynthesis protein E4
MPKIPSNQHGAAWGDYDNDGHLDLIVTAGNPDITHNVLYHNNGDGTFSPITSGAIYEDTSLFGFHAPSWGDYDSDGFLDLFIGGHDVHNRLFHNNGDGSFTRIMSGVLVDAPSDSEGRASVDYDNDGDLDLFVSNASTYTNALYRNDGNGVFTPVMNELTSRVEGTAAVCWADYNSDGLLDLFLANHQKNSLYHNNGDGTFTSIIDSAVVADTILPTEFFASCAWGDYDNDGFIDLFFTAAARCRDQTAHNFLYHNNGDGTFTKVTEGSVVRDLSNSQGPSWGDYDNDGFLDLFVSQASLCLSGDEVPNLLYHNNGNSNAWLNVKLVGTVSNRSAIGAKVRVKAFYRGETRWQLREISGGDSQSNQQSLNAEFGLADATNIDTVRVEWPSGMVQELRDVAPRQVLTIHEAP